MITLLLAVFIVLYSFSVVDLRKFEEVAGALGEVFHGGTPGGGRSGEGILPGGSGIKPNRAALISEIRSTIDRELSDQLRHSVSLTHRDGVVTISLKADAITFPIGQADLTPEARRILHAVGRSLKEAQLPMLVEGHTCDLPIGTVRFPSNWELSAQRATNVMVHLIRRSAIAPHHVSAVGYAHTRPIVANESEQARARNRRVDIVILSVDGGTRGMNHAETVTEQSQESAGLRLRPVQLQPQVDLQARHYQSTGRSVPDRAERY